MYYRRTNELESFEQLKNRTVENIDIETALANNQNWSLIFKLEQETLKLVAKIKENKDLLSQHFEFSQGYIPYRRSDLIKEYGEIKGNKIVEERLWHSEEKLNEEYLPEIFGRELNRYGIINKSKTSFVKYGKHLAGYIELKYFNQKRLLVREITNPFIIATLL